MTKKTWTARHWSTIHLGFKVDNTWKRNNNNRNCLLQLSKYFLSKNHGTIMFHWSDCKAIHEYKQPS